MIEAYRAPPRQEGDHVLVTVASYSTAVEAEMARALLQDRGITAFARESAGFNPLVNIAAGGAIVEVRSYDEPQARALLEHVARTSTTDDNDSDGDGEVRCPRCELTYCFHETSLRSASSGAMFVGPLIAVLLLPFGLTGKRWRCHKCLHVWDDPSQGPARMTPLDPDDPRPVFRLRRHRAGTGLLLGSLLMMLFWAGVGAVHPPLSVALLLFGLGFGLPLAGYKIGRRTITDLCSAPSCRAVLPRGAEDCPLCKGAVVGVIDAAHKHFSEAAAFRRELAASKTEDRRTLPKRLKKKRRALPAAAKPVS